MSKTAWAIVVVILVLIILYVVYNKFYKNKVETKTVIPNIVIPVVKATPSAVVSSEPVFNQNNNTDYTGYKDSLNAVLALLGYKIINNGNTRIASATGKTLEKVQLKYQGNNLVQLEGNWMVDKEKWDLFQQLGLLTMTYDSTSEEQAYILYNKFIQYFGQYFFDLSAQKITEASKKAIPVVDCNSHEYKNKLLRLSTNLKQAGNAYQVAVYNLNNVDNAENTQALNRTGKTFNEADIEYKKHAALCKIS